MRALQSLIGRLFESEVNGIGLGLFRIAFSLVALQEVVFLFYFRHLIFDPLPYLDRASPVLHLMLLAWMAILLCLALGYHTYRAAIANYFFWIVFVVFTPMWQDFDGGFDQLMTGSSLMLIFLPSNRRLALDPLRNHWNDPQPEREFSGHRGVPLLAYLFPLGINLGLLYLDSGIHKISSEFWRNGMGAWLPASMPYYMSPIDMSFLLEHPGIERVIGYAVMVFQIVFVFLFWSPRFQAPLLVMGASFHIGIILSLNVYPFGFGMLVYYLLLIPQAWWDFIESGVKAKTPTLKVYFDEACPLCRRTVLILKHFDIRRAILFKGLEGHAAEEPALKHIPRSVLLTDLYCVDPKGKVRSGLDTYLRILIEMRYPAPLAGFLMLPGIHFLGLQIYRVIADRRVRKPCDAHCQTPQTSSCTEHPLKGWIGRHAGTPRQRDRRIAKVLVAILVLQLNSTLHYGVLYRWAGARPEDPALSLLDQASDMVINLSHAFFGISPHALYLHDHFDHYNRIVALTYRREDGTEQWLPFVNDQGRLLSPNWGRIQSMWANVAITSHMSEDRLEKFSRKVTAYYAHELGIDLHDAEFVIKEKQVEVPTQWEPHIRDKNLQGPWTDLGTLTWQGGVAHLNLRAGALSHDQRDRSDRPQGLLAPNH